MDASDAEVDMAELPAVVLEAEVREALCGRPEDIREK